MNPEWETAAWKIFNKHFEVAIPNIFLYSDDFLREVGIHARDPNHRRELVEAPRLVNKRLLDIIVLADKGAPVTFVIPGDGVIAYRIVNQHLRDWTTILTEVIHHPKPDLEGLEMMDNFCQLLYPHFVSRMAVNVNTKLEVKGVLRPFIGGTKSGALYNPDLRVEDAKAYSSFMPLLTELTWRKYGPVGKPIGSGDHSDF